MNQQNYIIMKKKLLAIILTASLSLVSSNVLAQLTLPIKLNVLEIDPTPYPGGHPKCPILVPCISIENYTLYFGTSCDGCTLNIVDENDVVVYTFVIPSGTTSLALPSNLSGKYELQLINGNYLFWGVITL